MFTLPKPFETSAGLAPALALLKDTLVDPRFVSERWDISQAHLAGMRREQRGLPFIRLPTGKMGKGSIRYRMSDVLEAEARGTMGALNAQRVLFTVGQCPLLSKEQAGAVIDWLRTELAR